MNSFKISFLLFTLLSAAMPASADISYLNPATWYSAAKRAFNYSSNYSRLQELYPIKLEIENFRKMEHGVTSSLQSLAKGTSTADQKELTAIQKQRNTLKEQFKKSQAQWKIAKANEWSNDYAKVMAQLEKAIEQKEQEIGQFERPSWFKEPSLYQQLKTQENLPVIQKEVEVIKNNFFGLSGKYNNENLKNSTDQSRNFLNEWNQLEEAFTKKQKEWQLNPKIYSLTGITLFKTRVLAPELARIKRLKAEEKALTEELIKTAQIKENNFLNRYLK